MHQSHAFKFHLISGAITPTSIAILRPINILLDIIGLRQISSWLKDLSKKGYMTF